ncbi:MAG: hypothetical protein C3L25_11440 [Candidatus Sedimenticola endophacoides]|uniref:Metallo-beta-lactamase domain-containing protein n=1 Tax=Candidatus Sedimenticola endophacoides TaxID=2548426 RepID=A0A6N4E7R2_9GAMM|nr:MAG: hypothetical protein C3L26_11535 [Candidatus Sedimenticola endophacoides]PUE01982.1 MAG: hypothetical protein C3L25_11440 [Candidatus Sedimenticola endophacoides]PUE05006.1 MAG: hypothetical protein C3L24_02150 [Candidatus Sedimenticola endophacoides]
MLQCAGRSRDERRTVGAVTAVALASRFWGLGCPKIFHEVATLLPYLLIDSRGEDVVLFDPGSIPDFPVVMRKVIDVIPPETISLVVVSHQDPDVCGNLAVLEDVIDRDDLKIAAHLNTVRLIEHLGLRSEFYAVDQHDYRYTLKSGRELEFIYLPFLHSPGAIATFDAKTNTLVSGDLFGAISDDESLFVPESFPRNMDSFHQAYMPANSVLRHAMERLSKYDIKRILPQHGSIIEDDDVQECRYLVKDFGTSQSPKSTRQRDSRYCPDRPALITTPSRTLQQSCSCATPS